MNDIDTKHFKDILKKKVDNSQYFVFYPNKDGSKGKDYIQVLPNIYKEKDLNLILKILQKKFHFEFLVCEHNVYCDMHIIKPYDDFF